MPEDNILDIIMAITLEGQSLADLEGVRDVLEEIEALQGKIDIDMGDAGTTIKTSLTEKLKTLQSTLDNEFESITTTLDETKSNTATLIDSQDVVINMLKYIQAKFDVGFVSNQSSAERLRKMDEISQDPNAFYTKMYEREPGLPGGRLDPINLGPMIEDLLGQEPDNLKEQMNDLVLIMAARTKELEKMGSPIAKFSYDTLARIQKYGYVKDMRSLYSKLFPEEATVGKIFKVKGVRGDVEKQAPGTDKMTGDIQLQPTQMKGYKQYGTEFVKDFLKDKDVADLPSNVDQMQIAYEKDRGEIKKMITRLELEEKYIPDIIMSKEFMEEYLKVAPEGMDEKLGTRKGDLIVKLSEEDIELISGKTKMEIAEIVRKSYKITDEGAGTIAELLFKHMTTWEEGGAGGIARIEVKNMLTAGTFNTAMNQLGDSVEKMVVALRGSVKGFDEAYKQVMPKAVAAPGLGMMTPEAIVERTETEMTENMMKFVMGLPTETTNEDLKEGISGIRDLVMKLSETVMENIPKESVRYKHMSTLLEQYKKE